MHVNVFYRDASSHGIVTRSAKGQLALDPPSRAAPLAHALDLATRFRFQFEARTLPRATRVRARDSFFLVQENAYQCGMVATGKYFKISSCAGMVTEHAEMHDVVYDSFLVMRCDP